MSLKSKYKEQSSIFKCESERSWLDLFYFPDTLDVEDMFGVLLINNLIKYISLNNMSFPCEK